MSKRPRGLWKSLRSNGKAPESVVTDIIHIEHVVADDDPENLSYSSSKKRRLSSSNSSLSQSQERLKSDVEDWEDIKDLFSNAVYKYEGEAQEEAAELFRQVIHKSDHLLRLYPDPFQLLSNGSDSRTGGWKIQPDGTSLLVHQQYSSSRDPIRTNDPLTTFHYVYGTSLLFLGKILESHPFLAKDMEPVNSPAFYLAALDVLEDGENALHAAEGHKSLKEDWKLAISLGRTLVCLADEKLRRLSQMQNPTPSINFHDDLWPKDSAFGPSFSRRPPLTRRVTLPPMTPHETMLQATDQFSRAMLHMPHVRRNHRHRKSKSPEGVLERETSTLTNDEVDAPPTIPGLSCPSRKLLQQIRPRILYAIANDVLSIADRMQTAFEKEFWSKWVDEIFMQMEMEDTYREDWSHSIAVGRGRCWLVIGATRFEAIENEMEDGNAVLDSPQANSARVALLKAVKYLEQARANRSPNDLQDPFVTDVPPMLGEAFVTLAALTPDGSAKDHYFSKAAAEGVNIEEEDEVMETAN